MTRMGAAMRSTAEFLVLRLADACRSHRAMSASPALNSPARCSKVAAHRLRFAGADPASPSELTIVTGGKTETFKRAD